MTPIRVIIVDDSATMRSLISASLRQDLGHVEAGRRELRIQEPLVDADAARQHPGPAGRARARARELVSSPRANPRHKPPVTTPPHTHTCTFQY